MPTIAVPKSFTYHTTLDNVIGRTGVAHSDIKPELRVVAPPEFKGEPGLWTPEDLFVVSVESCLMLTFAGIAEKRGLRVLRYESSAEGLLEWLAVILPMDAEVECESRTEFPIVLEVCAHLALVLLVVLVWHFR